MREVLLHLGLRKTGTTAAQSFLFTNRALIWPFYALVLPYRTRNPDQSEAATRYSVIGTSDTMSEFSDQMRRFLKSLTFNRKRGPVLFEENFSGLRPERNIAVGYDHAPEPATCLVDLVRDRFTDEEVQITLYRSLRQRENWLRSLLAHDLQRPRKLQKFEVFSDYIADIASPKASAEENRSCLALILVYDQWLEDLRARDFGPGIPAAEFLDLPEAEAEKLVGATRTNTDLPEDLLAQMLEINRFALDDAALIDQKAALVGYVQNKLIGTE